MDIKTCEEYVLNELQVAQRELEETKKKLEESNNAVKYLQQVAMIVAPIVNYKEGEDGSVLVGGTNYTLDPENDKDLIQALAPLFAPKKDESNEVQDAEEVPTEKAE